MKVFKLNLFFYPRKKNSFFPNECLKKNFTTKIQLPSFRHKRPPRQSGVAWAIPLRIFLFKIFVGNSSIPNDHDVIIFHRICAIFWTSGLCQCSSIKLFSGQSCIQILPQFQDLFPISFRIIKIWTKVRKMTTVLIRRFVKKMLPFFRPMRVDLPAD